MTTNQKAFKIVEKIFEMINDYHKIEFVSGWNGINLLITEAGQNNTSEDNLGDFGDSTEEMIDELYDKLVLELYGQDDWDDWE